MRRDRKLVALFTTILLSACSQPSAVRTADATPAFNQLADQYFDEFFKHNPSAATAAGFHKRDVRLKDYLQGEFDRPMTSCKICREA